MVVVEPGATAPEPANPTANPVDGRDLVEQQLDEFLTARRRGEDLDPAALAERAGGRAGELRELIDSATLLEDMKGARPRGLPMHAPQILGDYRVVAEIGRGGMGVVYEAEQMTLQRRVALKVLPTQALRSESRLMRFKREAQTAAKLHHTNIVPIFGVGEQDGVHYFVMQLIVGRPLDEVIRALRGDALGDRPSSRVRSGTLALSAGSAAEALRSGAFVDRPLSGGPMRVEVGPGDAAYYRSVASLGLQVADALTYAHAQGTLHRDIKPANLLLDAHGVLWVTDFGLAKVMEEDTLTHSGDLVGTLQYMAPEQFGGRVDERTDVHGLGLTLYELATLRPAFAGDSRGDLVDRVKNQEAAPPLRVRPGVPRDLDTIIRKATAKDPSHRYQTAAELRDDLERFLQDRPIRARPVSVVESGWRWCRRNRVLASVGGLAVLGLVSTAIVAVVGYWSTRNALARAESNVAMALQGYEDLFASVVGPELLRADDEDEGDVVALEATQRISEDTERMLQRMLVLYDKLATANYDNAAARQITARAYHRVGEIHRQLHKWPEAIANYDRAVSLVRELVASGDVTPGVWMQVQNGLCRTLWDSVRVEGRRPEPAETDEQVVIDRRGRAQALADEILAYDPQSAAPLVRFERARAHDLLGSSRTWGRGGGRGGRGTRGGREEGPRDPAGREGSPPELSRADAAVHHRQALALNQALRQQEPDNAVYRQATARSWSMLAGVLRPGNAAEVSEAAALQSDAVALLEELIAQEPKAAYRVDLIQALGVPVRFGGFRVGTRSSEEDLHAIRRTSELWDGLASDFPGNERYSEFALHAALNLASALSTDESGKRTTEPQRVAEMRALRQKALLIAERLATARPGETRLALTLANIRSWVAFDQLATDPSAALALYQRAKASVDALAETDWRVPVTALQLRVSAARELASAGQNAAAKVELEEAVGRLSGLDSGSPWPGRFTEGLVKTLVDVAERLGDHAQAEVLRKRLPTSGPRSGPPRERDG